MPETDQLLPSRNGFENTVKNTDGSIDLYFGPGKPNGVDDKNFIKTIKDRNFLACIRLYGAATELFDQKWKPDDLVKVK